MAKLIDGKGHRYGWRAALVLPVEYFGRPASGEAAQLVGSGGCTAAVVAALASAILLAGAVSGTSNGSAALSIPKPLTATRA